ncbi:MAG: Gfo/Idh/MocA family oxidoreductase [Atribacterota bacterium]|nr:Gfo/Idh/MocA family oxidoreductase [Atribacterota bacterium]
MSSEKFKIGLIGFGGIGEQHLLNLQRFASVSVEVICDQNESQLKRAQERLRVPCLTTNVDEVFAMPLQAVVVATPNVTHYPLVRRALLQGWHVLCEKPFAMNAAEAEELYHLAKERNIVGMVAFSYRFVPAVKMLRQILQNSQAGRIYHVRCHYLQSWLASPLAPYSWRLDERESGSGVLGDLGSHVFDLAEFITGRRFLRVKAYAKTFVAERKDPILDAKRKVTVDDAVAVWGEMEGGILLTAEMSRCATGRGNAFTIEVNGDRGGFILDVERPQELLVCPGPMIEYTHFRSNFASFPCPPYFGSSEHYFVQTETFVRALCGERVDGFPSFLDGLRTQVILDKCLVSIKEGRWQEL